MRIAIVGYGVAGIAAAIFLKRQGHEITHFEQADDPSPIGAGFLLQPTGLAVLDALGLGEAALARGAKIEQILGGDARGRPVINLRYGALEPGAFGLGIQRGALFDILRSADANAGELQTGTRIAGADPDQGVLFTLRGRQFGPFDLIVGADGASSYVRSALGPLKKRDWKYPWGAALALLDDPRNAFAGRVIQIFDREEHVSIWPVGSAKAGAPRRINLSWRIDVLEKESLFATGVDAWKRQVENVFPDVAPFLRQVTDPGQVHLAEYRDVELSATHVGKVVLIGDAAHCMSPQLGQGASMALLDAQALAEALGKHDVLEAALVAFEAARRDHVRTYQNLSRLTTPIFQSDNPTLIALRDRAFHRLSRVPMLKRAMLKTLAGKQVLSRGKARTPARVEPVFVSRGETDEAANAANPSAPD
jgi:2-polyprenyl-6-methoxyphenol hydroxylase-like FAD-dependent oxidoreductase